MAQHEGDVSISYDEYLQFLKFKESQKTTTPKDTSDNTTSPQSDVLVMNNERQSKMIEFNKFKRQCLQNLESKSNENILNKVTNLHKILQQFGTECNNIYSTMAKDFEMTELKCNEKWKMNSTKIYSLNSNNNESIMGDFDCMSLMQEKIDYCNKVTKLLNQLNQDIEQNIHDLSQKTAQATNAIRREIKKQNRNAVCLYYYVVSIYNTLSFSYSVTHFCNCKQ